MRLVGTLSNENHARRLAGYLKSKSIDTKCEVAFHTNGDTMSYQIWVLDEDRLQEAASDFARFVSSPAAAEFDAPILALAEPEPPREVLEEEEEEEEPEVRARPRAPLTTFLLALCAMVFFLNYFQEETFRADVFYYTDPISSSLRRASRAGCFGRDHFKKCPSAESKAPRDTALCTVWHRCFREGVHLARRLRLVHLKNARQGYGSCRRAPLFSHSKWRNLAPLFPLHPPYAALPHLVQYDLALGARAADRAENRLCQNDPFDVDRRRCL